MWKRLKEVKEVIFVEEKEKKIEDENQSQKVEIKVKQEHKKIPLIILCIVIIIIFATIFIFRNTAGTISELKVKSSLEKVVEKSELQTATYTYNFIAKKCKKENCNLNSNDINDFEMVVSCKGKVTAGIDLEKIEVEVDKENKKIVIKLPEPTLSKDPDIKSFNILNGDELSSSATAIAHNLCEETIIEKSKLDKNILKNAKEQSATVLEEYYKSWIKAYDDLYEVEIK